MVMTSAREDVNGVGNRARIAEIDRRTRRHRLQIAERALENIVRRRKPASLRFDQEMRGVDGNEISFLARLGRPVTESALVVLPPAQHREFFSSCSFTSARLNPKSASSARTRREKAALVICSRAAVREILEIKIETAGEAEWEGRSRRFQLAKLRDICRFNRHLEVFAVKLPLRTLVMNGVGGRTLNVARRVFLAAADEGVKREAGRAELIFTPGW